MITGVVWLAVISVIAGLLFWLVKAGCAVESIGVVQDAKKVDAKLDGIGAAERSKLRAKWTRK